MVDPNYQKICACPKCGGWFTMGELGDEGPCPFECGAILKRRTEEEIEEYLRQKKEARKRKKVKVGA